MLLTLLLLAAASPTNHSASPADRPLAIRADKVLLADGRTIEKGVIVIEDGVIRALGSDADVPSDAGLYDHSGWASAGLIALHGASGSTDETRDTTRAVLPEARIAWAYDPEHPELRDLLREGITSFVLTPSTQSLCGGASAVVKCSGGKIVAREAQLSLGFSDRNLSFNRFPTSHVGAVAELERLFQKPTGSIEKAKAGDLPVLFEVSERSDVERAIAFAKRHELNGALSGADWTGELAKEVKASGLSVVCAPLHIGEDTRTIRAVLALSAADVPFGFGLDAPWNHPASLRLAAAMCVRDGLAPAKAWRALSSESARIAGVEKKIGRLETGLDADIVLWSGDPLDLTSSVVAVYVDGKRVFQAEER